MPNADTLEDARLVEMGLDGDREAFGQLVARYQSPVCALAYSGCGDISHSEDLAQETFIIAWRKLGDLKEPAKFKSWLYGIARNLVKNAFRRKIRNPLASAGPLDEGLAANAAVSDPAQQAGSREEKEILWRSLERIPEAYREPLILFYRENQSIERVAAILDLSEDAVRQRLSRGRKLLQERTVALVERALEQTAPGQAFTLSVVSALPVLTAAAAASSAVGGAAIKGSTAGKAAATVGLLAVVKGALIKILPAAAWIWMVLKLPESRRERRFAFKAYAVLLIGAILFPLGLFLGIHAASGYWDAHPRTLTAVLLGSAFGFVAILGTYTKWMSRAQIRIQKEEAELSVDPHFVSLSEPYEYRSRGTFLGLPLLHVRWNCVEGGRTLAAKGWIALGNRAYGVLFASGTCAVACVSMAPLAIGLIGLGGFGIGLFSFGGMSAGFAAIGGAAIGYVAYGGGAIGWLGASGGAAVARHFAVGGGALAEHANDQAAQAFMQAHFFFRYETTIFNILVLNSFLLPPATIYYFKRKRRRGRQAAQLTEHRL